MHRELTERKAIFAMQTVSLSTVIYIGSSSCVYKHANTYTYASLVSFKLLLHLTIGIYTPKCAANIVEKYPDSIPPLDRLWLLVTLSADFANIGLTVARQPLLRLDISIFCQSWANVGPMVDFYSRGRQSNNRGFGETK